MQLVDVIICQHFGEPYCGTATNGNGTVVPFGVHGLAQPGLCCDVKFSPVTKSRACLLKCLESLEEYNNISTKQVKWFALVL